MDGRAARRRVRRSRREGSRRYCNGDLPDGHIETWHSRTGVSRDTCHKTADFATYRVMRTGREERSKGAFEELYDRVSRRLLLYLVGRMHDIDAATELWAECWAIAFAGWPRCKVRSDGEVEAWIFGIARNQLGHYYRSGEIRHRTLEQLQWTAPNVQENEHTQLELEANLFALRTLLREALDRLPVTRSRAVQLRVLEGLPYEEVAARLGCSEQAARAHVSRGLRQLQRQIDHEQIVDLEEAM